MGLDRGRWRREKRREREIEGLERGDKELDRTTFLLAQNLLHEFRFIFVVLGCGLI